MRPPRLTTRRLMALVIAAAVLLWAARLGRLSIEYREKASWCAGAVLAISREHDARTESSLNHYRSLRDRYERAARYP